jgi:hypothetical protein
MATAVGGANFLTQLPVSMRVAPTALEQSGTAGDYSFAQGSVVITATGVPAFNTATTENVSTTVTFTTGGVDGYSGVGRATNGTAFLGWSAEL